MQGSDQAGRLRLGTTLSSWRQRTAVYKQSDYIMVPSSWASAGRREIRSQSRHLELWVCNNINSLLDIRHHDFYPCDAVHKHSICFRKIFVKISSPKWPIVSRVGCWTWLNSTRKISVHLSWSGIVSKQLNLSLKFFHPLWGVKQVKAGKTCYLRAKCVHITRQMALAAAALLQTSR